MTDHFNIAVNAIKRRFPRLPSGTVFRKLSLPRDDGDGAEIMLAGVRVSLALREGLHGTRWWAAALGYEVCEKQLDADSAMFVALCEYESQLRRRLDSLLDVMEPVEKD